jgi:hypothetical protein
VLSVDEAGIVALARGTFEEAVLIERDVTLWGAWPAETIVTWGSGADLATVAVDGAEVELRNVTLTGAPGGLWVGGRSEVTLESVVVRDTAWIGIDVREGSTPTASRLLLQDVDVLGVQLGDGSTASLTGVVIERAETAGLRAAGSEPSHLVATDLVVRDMRFIDLDGHAVEAFEGSRVELSRAVLERARQTALQSRDASAIAATDAVVSDTEATNPAAGGDLDSETGAAATALAHGRVELQRACLVRARGLGAGSVLDGNLALTDVVIGETAIGTRQGDLGLGVHVATGGTAELTRVAIVRCHEVGMTVFGSTSRRATGA